jgi:hypothetical protein
MWLCHVISITCEASSKKLCINLCSSALQKKALTSVHSSAVPQVQKVLAWKRQRTRFPETKEQID